jgi:hypothetical protein
MMVASRMIPAASVVARILSSVPGLALRAGSMAASTASAPWWPELAEGYLRSRSSIATAAPAGRRSPTRPRGGPHPPAGPTEQPSRGEGLWHDGRMFVATTADHRVHAYHNRRERFEVIHDGLAVGSAPLWRVDQIAGSRAGDVFVCEIIATDEIDLGGDRPARPRLSLSVRHGASAGWLRADGISFDPSGSRMYVPRSGRSGATRRSAPGPSYEIRGRFRGRTPA